MEMNRSNDDAMPPAPSGSPQPSGSGEGGRGKHSPGYGGVFLRSCLVAGCATIMAPLFLFACFAVLLWFLAGTGDGGGIPRLTVLREGEKGAGIIAVIRIQDEIGGGGSPLDGDGTLADV